MFEIGTTLRDARVRRDISLQQAEDETKIRVKYIQAMENEDFDVLPAGTYVKGFLRTYAEYLGLDAQLMIDEYNERFGSGEHREHIIQPPRTAKAEAPKSPRKTQTNYILVAILAVVIVAVLAYLGWGNSSSQQPSLVTTSETESSVQTSTAPATTPATTPPPASTTPTQTQPQGLQSVTFTTTSTEVWIELHENNENGRVIWGGTLQEGESKSLGPKDFAGATKLWLNLGRIGGLQVTVNGKPQDLGTSAPVNFVITASGMTRQG